MQQLISSQLTFHVGRHRVSVPVAFLRRREVGLQVLLDEAVKDGLLGVATGVRGGSISKVDPENRTVV
jgi:hypothetical protein